MEGFLAINRLKVRMGSGGAVGQLPHARLAAAGDAAQAEGQAEEAPQEVRPGPCRLHVKHAVHGRQEQARPRVQPRKLALGVRSLPAAAGPVRWRQRSRRDHGTSRRGHGTSGGGGDDNVHGTGRARGGGAAAAAGQDGWHRGAAGRAAILGNNERPYSGTTRRCAGRASECRTSGISSCGA